MEGSVIGISLIAIHSSSRVNRPDDGYTRDKTIRPRALPLLADRDTRGGTLWGIHRNTPMIPRIGRLSNDLRYLAGGRCHDHQ